MFYSIFSANIFQFTPLHERQQAVLTVPGSWQQFQFTPLHERQPAWSEWGNEVFVYFNSRLYMRGNGILGRVLAKYPISIHASTWEATFLKFKEGVLRLFQFTPLHERQHDAGRRSTAIAISIHASTWEATPSACRFSPRCLFQFTPLHERQRVSLDSCGTSSLFQFTPLHERQHASLAAQNGYQIEFQFTPLHERQLDPAKHKKTLSEFQFTPLHERQQQKCTIFSIKSTQFSTKPCFFIVTSRKVVFFSIPVQYFL